MSGPRRSPQAVRHQIKGTSAKSAQSQQSSIIGRVASIIARVSAPPSPSASRASARTVSASPPVATALSASSILPARLSGAGPCFEAWEISVPRTRVAENPGTLSVTAKCRKSAGSASASPRSIRSAPAGSRTVTGSRRSWDMKSPSIFTCASASAGSGCGKMTVTGPPSWPSRAKCIDVSAASTAAGSPSAASVRIAACADGPVT